MYIIQYKYTCSIEKWIDFSVSFTSPYVTYSDFDL